MPTLTPPIVEEDQLVSALADVIWGDGGTQKEGNALTEALGLNPPPEVQVRTFQQSGSPGHGLMVYIDGEVFRLTLTRVL